jgi:hypothetical protein
MKRIMQYIRKALRTPEVPQYGWNIFSNDDRVGLTRQINEQIRKQNLQLF